MIIIIINNNKNSPNNNDGEHSVGNKAASNANNPGRVSTFRCKKCEKSDKEY